MNFLKKISMAKGGVSILVLLGIIASFIGGMQKGHKIETVYIVSDSIVTLTDTLTVRETTFVKLPAEIDTVTIVEAHTDTITQVVTEIEIPTGVASLDTLLEDGRLKLEYYMKPNYFNFTWQPIPLEIRCRQLVDGEITVDTESFTGFYAGLGTSKGWSDGWGATTFLAIQVPEYVVYLELDRKSYSFGVGKRIF